jgi:hypothetical protein
MEGSYGFVLTVVGWDGECFMPIGNEYDSDSDRFQRSGMVSFLSLKEMVQRLLDRRSLLRLLVLSEPDSLPRPAALAKVEIFVRLLYEDERS